MITRRGTPTIAALLVLTVFCAFVPRTAAAQDEPHSFRHEIFVLGMGGAYTAGMWRGSGLFYNPASLSYKRFHFNIPLRVEAGGIGGIAQARRIVDFYSVNEDLLRNIEQMPPQQAAELDRTAQSYDGTGGVIRVFPAVRIGWRDFGFQTYATFSGVPAMNSGIFQPRLDLNGFSDIGAIAGYSRQFFYRARRYDFRWYAGVAVKAFGRWNINHGFTIDEAARATNLYEELADAVDRRPAYGTGLDVGIIVPLTSDRSAHIGIVAQDLFTYGDVRPKTSLNAGLHYRLLPRLHVVADYRDVLNATDTPWQMHTYFGGELDLTMLRFRAGASQGYPAFGFGVNLWLLKVDFAYYLQERGKQLGNLTEKNIALELQFGLD